MKEGPALLPADFPAPAGWSPPTEVVTEAVRHVCPSCRAQTVSVVGTKAKVGPAPHRWLACSCGWDERTR